MPFRCSEDLIRIFHRKGARRSGQQRSPHTFAISWGWSMKFEHPRGNGPPGRFPSQAACFYSGGARCYASRTSHGLQLCLP